jgi:hypothetical protein
VGRRGVKSSFKLFPPVFATHSGGGEGIRGLCPQLYITRGGSDGKRGLTLSYTRGLEIVVLHVMVPQPYRFPLSFSHRYGNFTILEFSSKWVKGEGSLMTHSVGSVTTQRKVFKYAMASEPYRHT